MGIDDETGGIILAEAEGGGTKNDEGFTRLAMRLLLDSGSSRGIKGTDADREGDGICKVGTTGEATVAELEGGCISVEDW